MGYRVLEKEELVLWGGNGGCSLDYILAHNNRICDSVEKLGVLVWA
jgi:hypothetical protein